MLRAALGAQSCSDLAVQSNCPVLKQVLQLLLTVMAAIALKRQAAVKNAQPSGLALCQQAFDLAALQMGCQRLAP